MSSTAGNPTMESPHRIVRASAGSGKTYTLTNAYMKRLFEGESPGSMLATTFTRVAAGEILHRVLDRLSAAVVDASKRAELGDALGIDGLGAQRCAGVLDGLVGEMHRLSIMTIDSFFSRLAGAFCLELGLPMNYGMLDEDEDLELRERCVDQAIASCPWQEMVELLRLMQGDRISMQTHSAIMKAIRSGYAMYLATDGDRDPWEAVPEVGKKLDEDQITALCERLGEVELPTNDKGKTNGHWVRALNTCLKEIQESDWSGLIDGGFGGLVAAHMESTTVPVYHRHPMSDEFVTALLPFVEHARHVLSVEHNNRTLGAWGLMHRFDSVYRRTKMNSGRLTFDDPPRLLNEAQITGELEHLYYRLDSTLRHVMLDEFQDTSMPQFRLLEPILDELLSQNEEGRSVFVVGDVKQSLYTWRQAEPMLLGGMEQRWESLRVETLAESYRSSGIVLDTVNDIFGDLNANAAMQGSPEGMNAAAAWHEQYDRHKSAKDLPGATSLRVADIEDETDERAGVLRACADRVKELRDKSATARIAVLVRKVRDIYPVLSMLRDLGVDACENRGNPLVDSPAVAAAVSMLQVIEHPGNSAAVEHVMMTPLGRIVGLGRDRRVGVVASALRERISREGCVPLLTQWLKAGSKDMDQRGMIRFEQLIGLASDLESEGRGGAENLCAVAQSRRIDEPGHAPVRVMTIHSSKGLEFDAVVMPLIGQAWRVNPDSLLGHRASSLGDMTCVSRYPSKAMRVVNPTLNALYDEAFQKQINEELCCLYVATTRAKRSLDMIIAPDNKEFEPKVRSSDIIREALAPGSVAEPGIVLHNNTSDSHWAEGLDDPSIEVKNQSTGVQLKVRGNTRVRASRLSSVSPSSVDDGHAAGIERILRDDSFGNQARQRGVCIHAGFEGVEWIGDGGVDAESIREMLSERGFAGNDADDAIAEISGALGDPAVSALFDQTRWLDEHPLVEVAQVIVERPIAVRLIDGGEERLVKGRIDRLVLGRSGGHDGGQVVSAQIVDIKTDRAVIGMNGQELEQYAQRHRGQLELYRRCLAQMYRIEPQQVGAVLVYTACPGAVTLQV